MLDANSVLMVQFALFAQLDTISLLVQHAQWDITQRFLLLLSLAISVLE